MSRNHDKITVRIHPGIQSSAQTWESVGNLPKPPVVNHVPMSPFPVDPNQNTTTAAHEDGIVFKRIPMVGNVGPNAVQLRRHPGMTATSKNGGGQVSLSSNGANPTSSKSERYTGNLTNSEKYLVDTTLMPKQPAFLRSHTYDPEKDSVYTKNMEQQERIRDTLSRTAKDKVGFKMPTKATLNASFVERLQSQKNGGFGDSLGQHYGFYRDPPSGFEEYKEMNSRFSVQQKLARPPWKLGSVTAAPMTPVSVLKGNKPVVVPGNRGQSAQKYSGKTAKRSAYPGAGPTVPLLTRPPTGDPDKEVEEGDIMSDQDFAEATKYSNTRSRCEELWLDYGESTNVPETIVNEYSDLGCNTTYNFGEIGVLTAAP